MEVLVGVVGVFVALGLLIWRLNASAKKEVLLQENAKNQAKTVEYQNEVIKELSKHSSLDDTLNSLQRGEF